VGVHVGVGGAAAPRGLEGDPDAAAEDEHNVLYTSAHDMLTQPRVEGRAACP